MKRVYLTILAIVTICCIIFGTLVHVGGFFRHANLWPFAGKGERIEQEEVGQVSRVEIDGKLLDIEVRSGKTTAVYYSGDADLAPTWEVRDDTLVIKQAASGTQVNVRGAELTVELAKDATGISLQADTEMGEIDVEAVRLESCDLSTEMGNIEVEQSDLGTATLTAEMGDIDVDNCQFTNLMATTDMGEIEIETTQNLAEYQVLCETDMGDVVVNGAAQGKSYSRAGNAGTVTAKTNLGNVEVEAPGL